MKHLILLLFLAFGTTQAVGQKSSDTEVHDKDKVDYKCAVSTTWLSFSNFGKPETNTHHYEIRLGYQITPKDQIGIKLATWKLFAPMGIPLWDPNFLDREQFYPGRLKETGLGLTYQRKLWKGLFATLEVLPLFTNYLDEDGNTMGKGFKLYNSYHLGYHIPLFKKGRFYIEPQLHVNHWPINNNVSEEFRVLEENWNNYFIVEPNLYIGMKF